MTVPKLADRLLRCRPLVFYTARDDYVLQVRAELTSGMQCFGANRLGYLCKCAHDFQPVSLAGSRSGDLARSSLDRYARARTRTPTP